MELATPDLPRLFFFVVEGNSKQESCKNILFCIHLPTRSYIEIPSIHSNEYSLNNTLYIDVVHTLFR